MVSLQNFLKQDKFTWSLSSFSWSFFLHDALLRIGCDNKKESEVKQRNQRGSIDDVSLWHYSWIFNEDGRWEHVKISTLFLLFFKAIGATLGVKLIYFTCILSFSIALIFTVIIIFVMIELTLSSKALMPHVLIKCI